MSQVPLLPTLSSIEDEDAQSALTLIIQYLNFQDAGIQPWSKLVSSRGSRYESQFYFREHI